MVMLFKSLITSLFIMSCFSSLAFAEDYKPAFKIAQASQANIKRADLENNLKQDIQKLVSIFQDNSKIMVQLDKKFIQLKNSLPTSKQIRI